MHVYTLCDSFSSASSASDCDNPVFISKRNVSDRVVSGMGTLFSLDHKFFRKILC